MAAAREAERLNRGYRRDGQPEPEAAHGTARVHPPPGAEVFALAGMQHHETQTDQPMPPAQTGYTVPGSRRREVIRPESGSQEADAEPPIRVRPAGEQEPGCCGFQAPQCRRCRFLIALVIVLVFIVTAVLTWLIADKYNGKLPMTPPCGDDWIWYRNKCYYFSEAEGNWTTANESCDSTHSALAVFDDQQELSFVIAHKGKADRWIGLRKDQSNTWRWSNGSSFTHWFKIGGGSKCAYLNSEEASSARCTSSRHWICTKETLIH